MGQRRHAETLQHRHTLLGRGCLNLSAGFGGRFCWFRFYSCEHFKALKVVDVAGIDSDRQPGGALHERRGYIDRQLTEPVDFNIEPKPAVKLCPLEAVFAAVMEHVHSYGAQHHAVPIGAHAMRAGASVEHAGLQLTEAVFATVSALAIVNFVEQFGVRIGKSRRRVRNAGPGDIRDNEAEIRLHRDFRILSLLVRHLRDGRYLMTSDDAADVLLRALFPRLRHVLDIARAPLQLMRRQKHGRSIS